MGPGSVQSKVVLTKFLSELIKCKNNIFDGYVSSGRNILDKTGIRDFRFHLNANSLIVAQYFTAPKLKTYLLKSNNVFINNKVPPCAINFYNFKAKRCSIV